MSQKFQPVRGTQDFLPEMANLYRKIEGRAWQTANIYNFQEIVTPIFEFSDVFHRSLGETSDAVTKETYDFKDRSGDSLTLRPEGTAAVVRAFVSNGMAQNLPLKLYYSGPMFRYERPQKGRYRQFHQIGAEILGIETPSADVECIALAWQILANLGLQEKVMLEINSIGDRESRSLHRQALVEYLMPRKSELSVESQIRLEKNPLRILDSKDPQDKKILTEGPSLQNYWTDATKNFFDQVLKGLDQLGIKPHLNPNLVRGFDYYMHTVFEITTTHLGAQSAVISGGRYDGLIEQMGGPSTPAVGWGGGIERLMLLVQAESFVDKNELICVIPADESADSTCQKLAFDLRKAGIKVELLLTGNMGKKMKRANKLNAGYAIIIGEAELAAGKLSLKNLQTGEQTPETFESLIKKLIDTPARI